MAFASALPAPAASASARPSGVGVSGRFLSRLIILLAAGTLVVSLCGVYLNPRRFQIHPIPYVSDAGMFDPERIVLSMGLSSSAALFLPFCSGLYSYHLSQRKSGVDTVPKLGLVSGLVLCLSLIAFACVPGWYLPHHFLAALFAVSSAAWCVCVGTMRCELRRPHKLVYGLGLLQAAIVAVFAVVWASVITGWPWRMVPNKDIRFVVLALLEYIGTASFLVVVHRVGTNELGNCRIEILAAAKQRIERLAV